MKLENIDFTFILDNGILKLFKQFKFTYYGKADSKQDYYSLFNRFVKGINNDYYKFIDLICLACHYHTNLFDEKIKLLNHIDRVIINHYKRYERLKTRVKYIVELYDEPIFITFTFNDNFVNCKSHRKLVQDFLKKHCECYVANIDFGGQFGRMHYHCVASSRINPCAWKYGACNVKRIIKNSDSIKYLSLYTTKLCQHALKGSTKGFKVIYSRLPKK